LSKIQFKKGFGFFFCGLFYRAHNPEANEWASAFHHRLRGICGSRRFQMGFDSSLAAGRRAAASSL
jgi:hypothetical protein